MSNEDVRAIIRRALTEPEYMKLLHKHPEKALKGFDLTEEEEAALKKIDLEPVESALGELEERITMASLFSIASLLGSGDLGIDAGSSSPTAMRHETIKNTIQNMR
jgi:hypothetical protein